MVEGLWICIGLENSLAHKVPLLSSGVVADLGKGLGYRYSLDCAAHAYHQSCISLMLTD